VSPTDDHRDDASSDDPTSQAESPTSASWPVRVWDTPEPVSEPAPRMTGMRFMRERMAKAVGIVIALMLVLPIGGWAVDALLFRNDANEVTEAVPELAGAVALVTRLGCDGTSATGSGFAVDLNGTPAVITNRHVVDGAAAVGLRMLDGAPGPDVTAVFLAPGEDVAVLVLAEALPATLGLTAPGAPGTPVRLVGFPGARPITSSGQIEASDGRRVLLSMEVGPGASGAPVVDADGFVVAQVVARQQDGSGVAIPADRVAEGIRTAQPAPAC
jgi:S1-C subfamily serine protease